jgi:hypothetical protein
LLHALKSGSSDIMELEAEGLVLVADYLPCPLYVLTLVSTLSRLAMRPLVCHVLVVEIFQLDKRLMAMSTCPLPRGALEDLHHVLLGTARLMLADANGEARRGGDCFGDHIKITRDQHFGNGLREKLVPASF